MKHVGTVKIETPRLILRKFTLDDAEKMFTNWASSENVTKYLPWSAYKSVDGVIDYLKNLQNNYLSDYFYRGSGPSQTAQLDDFHLPRPGGPVLRDHGERRYLRSFKQLQPAPDDYHLHVLRHDRRHRAGRGDR